MFKIKTWMMLFVFSFPDNLSMRQSARFVYLKCTRASVIVTVSDPALCVHVVVTLGVLQYMLQQEVGWMLKHVHPLSCRRFWNLAACSTSRALVAIRVQLHSVSQLLNMEDYCPVNNERTSWTRRRRRRNNTWWCHERKVARKGSSWRVGIHTAFQEEIQATVVDHVMNHRLTMAVQLHYYSIM